MNKDKEESKIVDEDDSGSDVDDSDFSKFGSKKIAKD